jgi:hypothetical protein
MAGRETNQGAVARRQLLMAGAGAGALALLAGCGGGNTEKVDDPVVPTLTITSNAPGAATGPFTVRFTFSTAVSNFLTNRIFIRNGALGGATLTRLSDTVYTLVVTPSLNFRGVGEVQVLAGAFQDATGQVSNTTAYTFGQEIDTVVVSNEPTLVISHNVTTALATSAVTFTFTFSTDVGDSFTSSDIQITAGTLGSFSKVSGTVCTAVVTLPAGTSGILIVQVPAASFQSTAGVSSQQDYNLAVFFAIPA